MCRDGYMCGKIVWRSKKRLRLRYHHVIHNIRFFLFDDIDKCQRNPTLSVYDILQQNGFCLRRCCLLFLVVFLFLKGCKFTFALLNTRAHITEEATEIDRCSVCSIYVGSEFFKGKLFQRRVCVFYAYIAQHLTLQSKKKVWSMHAYIRSAAANSRPQGECCV